jgi:hypothetical protein
MRNDGYVGSNLEESQASPQPFVWIRILELDGMFLLVWVLTFPAIIYDVSAVSTKRDREWYLPSLIIMHHGKIETL